jgi:hypothetical protein
MTEESESDTFRNKLQLWGTVMTTLVTFGTIGYALVSEIHSIRSELIIIRERQNINTDAISKFTSPGPRFTKDDGDRLRAEVERNADRLRTVEQDILLIKDRASRK